MTELTFDALAGTEPAFDDIDRDDAPEGAEKPGDWFAVARSVTDHPVVGLHVPAPAPVDPQRRAWTPTEAWVFGIVGKAAFRRHVARDVNGLQRLVDAGQLLASRKALGRRFNWSEKAVRLFIAKLINAGMLAVSKGPGSPLNRGQGKGQGSNVLTVCNYGKYQSAQSAKGQGKGQPPRQKGATYNNNKLKHPPYPQRGPGFGIDHGKRDALAAQSPDVDDSSQLQPWQNPKGLEQLDTANPGAVRRMARQSITDNRGRWDVQNLGPLVTDNPILQYLTPEERTHWLAAPQLAGREVYA